MQIHYQDISGAVGSLLKVKRTGLRRKVSCRGETRLLRLVKRDGGKVLKDVTNDFNVGNGSNKVNRRTVQRILYKNQIYQRFIRKRIAVKEINPKKPDLHGAFKNTG